MSISRKHVVSDGECNCWPTVIKDDLEMYGNHFCSDGTRLHPESIKVNPDGTYEYDNSIRCEHLWRWRGSEHKWKCRACIKEYALLDLDVVGGKIDENHAETVKFVRDTMRQVLKEGYGVIG